MHQTIWKAILDNYIEVFEIVVEGWKEILANAWHLAQRLVRSALA